MSKRIVLIIFVAVVLAGCASDRQEGGRTGTIQIDGSSTVFPITEAVAEEFMRDHRGIRVTVGVSGTGGGFSKFLRGETDINNASRAITTTELELASQNGISFIEIPVAYDGLAVVVHPSNDWAACLTIDELNRIWEAGSTISSWSEVRDGFPDRPISLYGPGTDSGTYDYFIRTVTSVEGGSRSDFTASEDDNVLVQGIAGDPGALGFFGFAYYDNNRDRLNLVGIDSGEGCVEPSLETVRDGEYQPLSRPEFIYVRTDRADDPAVAEFVHFYIEHAATLAAEVGYIPLDPEAYNITRTNFDERVEGTVFGGDEARPGMRVVETLQAHYGSSIDDSAR